MQNKHGLRLSNFYCAFNIFASVNEFYLCQLDWCEPVLYACWYDMSPGGLILKNQVIFIYVCFTHLSLQHGSAQ